MIDAVFWWVGAVVCGAASLAGVTWLLTFPLDYCWRKWGDAHALLKVVEEAKRQGRPVFRSESRIKEKP